MSTPWYRKYFTEDYWALTGLKYSSERTASELAYLQAVLEEKAPGRRVVDLGCGIGRHAIGLAQAGFEVTGLDVSECAIGEAKRHAARAGVDIRWEIVDLLAERVLIARQVFRQLIDLHHHHRAETDGDPQRAGDRQDHGQMARQTPSLQGLE